MTHACVYSSTHSAYDILWTWQCSCGVRCRDNLMGACVAYLPSFGEASEKFRQHLMALDAAVADFAA